ncbi:MAG: EamA family transporter, partial [Methanosarcinaceae archaeon]|nr:EamA family transporter [Methanosarcinaceae archaeon]
NGTVSFVGLTTLVTIVAGVILLHESFTWIQVAGTALILGGVYLANASDIIKAGKPDGSR